MRFCANIAMLFTEHPFLDRFAAAADAGFDAVEMWWPDENQLEAIPEAAAAAGVDVVRFALDAGDLGQGDQGLLCLPDRAEEFRRSVDRGLQLAVDLDCTMVNALAGRSLSEWSRSEQLAHGSRQMAWLADRADAQGVTVLMEANTSKSKPGYLITTTAQALAFLDGVARDNLGIVFDTFHVQRSEGDLTATIREHSDQIVHVQLGDAPDRHEPGTGEIRFGYVIQALLDQGYDGFLGLEYRPATTTLESLRWLPPELRSGPVGERELSRIGW